MRSLAAALKDFGAPQMATADAFVPPPEFPAAMDFPASELPIFSDAPAPEEVDVDALVGEAVAAAEAALTERLAEEHARSLKSERDRHAKEMAELQNQFATDAGKKMLAAMEEMENRVVELTSAVTARILGVVLSDDLRERSIGRLSGIIREALADDEAVRVRVRGSLTLYEELKETLPRHADRLDFAESDSFDLSVTIDDSVFETRLAEWSSALSEVLS